LTDIYRLGRRCPTPKRRDSSHRLPLGRARSLCTYLYYPPSTTGSRQLRGGAGNLPCSPGHPGGGCQNGCWLRQGRVL